MKLFLTCLFTCFFILACRQPTATINRPSHSPYLILFPQPSPESPDNLIYFKENSLEMTDIGKRNLALFSTRFDSLKRWHMIDVSLEALTLKSELKANKDIDILRCKAVAKYMLNYERIKPLNLDINFYPTEGWSESMLPNGPHVAILWESQDY